MRKKFVVHKVFVLKWHFILNLWMLFSNNSQQTYNFWIFYYLLFFVFFILMVLIKTDFLVQYVIWYHVNQFFSLFIEFILYNLAKIYILYINDFSVLDENALDSFVENLMAISLAGNRIDIFPSLQLRRANKLSHLNLGIYSFN